MNKTSKQELVVFIKGEMSIINRKEKLDYVDEETYYGYRDLLNKLSILPNDCTDTELALEIMKQVFYYKGGSRVSKLNYKLTRKIINRFMDIVLVDSDKEVVIEKLKKYHEISNNYKKLETAERYCDELERLDRQKLIEVSSKIAENIYNRVESLEEYDAGHLRIRLRNFITSKQSFKDYSNADSILNTLEDYLFNGHEAVTTTENGKFEKVKMKKFR